MKASISALVLLLCVFSLGTSPAARATGEFKGNWTIMPSEEPGQVRFGLIHHRDGHNSQSESDWPVGEFLGLDLSSATKREVTFAITRDAGRFDCKGYLEDGEGAGIFRFTPDAQYARDMNTLGFNGVDDEMQFAMAVHDVSLDFARTMKAEKLPGLNTEMLMAFRIHGVTPVFIAKVETLGYKNLEPDQLVAMRIHGVTPEYIADLKARGLKNLSIDQMVNLRIHGIN